MSQNRVLVVDDDPDVCSTITAVAERQGYAAAAAADAGQFREIYPSFGPSLVFLDLALQGREDGVELLRFLAQRDCKARIVLISGAGDKVVDTVARLARVHGPDLLRTFAKPLAPAVLETVLGQSFEGRHPITAHDLREALANRELRLHYQPKVNLKAPPAGAIDAVEALLRWRHPRYGHVGPSEFVPIGESAGLSRELTDFVVGEAAAQARRWHGMGLELTVAVNLPAPLLGDLELADRIDDCLRAHEVPSSRLILEVTESGVMADVAKAMETLTRLRLKGLRLSMDDFGTGYSSLLQLYRLPFSELKIDRTFVADLTRSKEAQIIVQSIIDLAHKLGMQVCGEGVEDPEAARILRAWGCDRAQGFCFAPALPSERLEALLRDPRGRPQPPEEPARAAAAPAPAVSIRAAAADAAAAPGRATAAVAAAALGELEMPLREGFA